MRKTNVTILAHNIRSLWNIGSFFRTADAFGVSHIYLTGYTAQPPREEIHKTALGAEEWLPWSYSRDPIKVLRNLKKKGFQAVALEITRKSEQLDTFSSDKPVCLIVGHEILGVPADILKICDNVVHIPMRGKKESLNVSVALGIALYKLTVNGDQSENIGEK
ncbi:hypothetical protein A3A67_00960 [Candidatus Peribacteria bacterium RIFCSPLOWO2_01_FULL_51_18]|nr:MAG: hypothetical protein A3C52_00640 [Candidatus Peribacteria bacterium RIFCSPHIGHO2_02_FULL_51_15]OGJ65961.1 MAG: hypothetical protein A3A67_00960 [Candidatus Peribacteria bacterium RIFCSPLOWO2_01_FULL_51_18]